MKKKQNKLIALAIAGIVSNGVFAQSNATIFGVVDLSVESGKYSDSAGTLTRMASGGNLVSRIGFRGSEDMGGGLSANFLLEAQPSPDNGAQAITSQFWNRSATVGLSSTSWGSVNLGRQYTPWFSAVSDVDPFYGAGLATYYAMVFGDTRMNNSIRWDSPSMNGLSAAVMFGLGQDGDATGIEGTTATTKKLGKEGGVKLSYANGPIRANYGYDTQTTAVSPDVDTKRNQLNGSYDFKVVKLGLNWNSNKKSDNTLDDRAWSVTVVVPVFGTDLFKSGYTRLHDKVTANKDARLIAIGYEHPLSKRTNLYANYAKINNDQAASKTLNGGVAVVQGFDPSALQVGIRHLF
ncbi:MAG: porin [Betaproteobacteria bacterium]|nr:porin [Betaproteobacteria bacterium]